MHDHPESRFAGQLLPRGLALACAAGLGALAVLSWRFGLGGVGQALARFTPAYCALSLGLGCAARVGYALRWRSVMRALGGQWALGRLLAARLGADAIGSLLPTGRLSGDPVRTMLIGSGGRRTVAVAGVAIDRVMEIIGNAVCVLVSVTVFAYASTLELRGPHARMLVGGMVLLLVGLLVPLVMLWRGVRPLRPLYGWAARYGSEHWQRAAEAVRHTETLMMQVLRDRPGVFLRGVGASLCIEALLVGEYYFWLATFAIRVDLPTVLMALVASGLVRVVPVPAGLGTLEGSQVAVLAVVAGRPDIGFVAGVVLRLHETLWQGVGLLALSGHGWSLVRSRPVAAATTA